MAPFVIFALADLQSAAEPSLAVAAFVPELLVDGSAAGGLAVVVADCDVAAEGWVVESAEKAAVPIRTEELNAPAISKVVRVMAKSSVWNGNAFWLEAGSPNSAG